MTQAEKLATQAGTVKTADDEAEAQPTGTEEKKLETQEQPTSTGGTSPGLFNFQDVMKQFYEWEPSTGEDDNDMSGIQMKRTFQGNMLQSVLDNQMAKDLAYTNQEIATGAMTTAAQLELANQSAVMDQEFTLGMQKMGAEYDMQSRFATDEANRELNRMGAGADLQQNQTKLEGAQNRLNIEAQGREEQALQKQRDQGALAQIDSQGNVDLSKIIKQGTQDRANIVAQGNVDQSKIAAQGNEDRLSIGAQGAENRKAISAQGSQDRKNISAQGDVDINKIGAQGDVDISKIGAQGAIDKQMQRVAGKQAVQQQRVGGQETRKNIGAQGFADRALERVKGSQTRKNMQQQTIEEGNTANRQSNYARSLAGMF